MAGRKRKSEEKVEEVMPEKRVEMEVLPEKRAETENLPEKNVEMEILPETKTKTEDQRIELSKEYNKSSPVSETTGIPELPEANEEQETRNGASISDEFNSLLQESDEDVECLSFSKWSVCCFPVYSRTLH